MNHLGEIPTSRERFPDSAQGVQVLDFVREVWPFGFVVNRDLTVLDAGASLQKLSPGFRAGVHLGELVSILQRRCALTWEELVKGTDTPFVLSLNNVGVRLRGQWIELPCPSGDGKKVLAFLAVLYSESMEELTKLGVGINDFAPHDITVEMMMLRQALEAQRTDHCRLVTRLEDAANREAQMIQAERVLAHDLNISADLLFRFGRNGVIETESAVNPLYLSASENTAEAGMLYERFPEFEELARDAIDRLDGEEKMVSIEFTLARQSRQFWFEARITKTLNDNYLMLARDVTEQRNTVRRMRYLAHHDQLTKLPNRAYFEQRMTRALRGKRGCALLLIDLNEFKSINDCYGHATGDEVLSQVGTRIRSACGKCDVPARLGGDEFAVLSESYGSREEVAELAKHIVKWVSAPLHLNQDLVIEPEVSIGVVFPGQDESPEDAMRKADLAMYRSKDAKDESITHFEDIMFQEFFERVALKADMRLAIARNEFVNYYQPIFRLDSMCAVKCEALVRWRHPYEGVLSPSSFIEIAEQSGLVATIDRAVLKQACLDAKQWSQMGYDIGVSTNVSPPQLNEDHFVEYVKDCLRESGLSPDRLTLEITERLVVLDPDKVSMRLAQLKDLGVKVAIDDFGVGYSSLSYLATLPLDVMKIDKSFVRDVANATDSGLRVMEAMINLGQTLGMEIVAEGIEEHLDEDNVRRLGCELGQGYLYSRPIPADEMADLLTEYSDSGRIDRIKLGIT